jgi:predicted nucleic acid-binding protein
MTYLLDSDVVIDYFKKCEPSFGFIASTLTSEHVAISTITLTEVRAGWDRAQADFLRPLLGDLFEIIDVTVAIADLAGEQIKKYAEVGKRLSTTDTLIAATALHYDYCLVTRNLKDFPMPELHLYEDLFSRV